MDAKKTEVIKITVAYKIGDRVYIVHDPEQCLAMVTGIYVTQTGVKYNVSIADDSAYYDEIELSTEKTVY